jgi:hypothetical protein
MKPKTARQKEIEYLDKFFKDKINIEGHWLKKRSIELISERYQKAKETRARLYKNKFDKWFEKGKALGGFWANRASRSSSIPIWSKDHYPVLFTFDGDGYSRGGVSSNEYEKIVRMIPEKELPLMLNDPDKAPMKEFVIKRLEGKLEGFVQSQKLAKEHENYEIRSRHCYDVSSLYLNMLYIYVRDKFRDKIYDRYRQPAIVTLKIKEHIYNFVVNCGGDLKLIDDTYFHEVTSDEIMSR